MTPPKDSAGRFTKRDPEPATPSPDAPPAPGIPTPFVVALALGVILLVVGRR